MASPGACDSVLEVVCSAKPMRPVVLLFEWLLAVQQFGGHEGLTGAGGALGNLPASFPSERLLRHDVFIGLLIGLKKAVSKLGLVTHADGVR